MGATIAWNPTTCSPGIQGTIVQDFAKLMVASILGNGDDAVNQTCSFLFQVDLRGVIPQMYPVPSNQKWKICVT